MNSEPRPRLQLRRGEEGHQQRKKGGWGEKRRKERGGKGRQTALTWFVLFALGVDGERVDIEPKVPGHNLHQQHWE